MRAIRNSAKGKERRLILRASLKRNMGVLCVRKWVKDAWEKNESEDKSDEQ